MATLSIRRHELVTAALLCFVSGVTAIAPLAAQQSGQGRTASGLSPAEIRTAARQVDHLVERDLQAHEMRPNPAVDDATFTRRVYLAIAGRIPTLAEIESALDTKRTNRRAELIDELLDSRGYESHMFNYLADLLRAKTRLARQTSGEPYLHWLKDAVAQNKPYDVFVTELLTASGPAHKEGNGATGYYLRDRGMPQDNMANTARVFLGTRLECAQCHNHPFDKWTQKQFFEMTAFTGGMQYRDDSLLRSGEGRRLQQLARQLREEHGPNAQRALRRMAQGVTTGIAGSGAGITRLPKDYQYDDARPNQFVTANVLFGEGPQLDVQMPREKRRNRRARPNRRRNQQERLPEIDSRAAYAEWMTSPDNPRFAAVIANRMWKRVMGIGVVEPVDNWNDKTQPSNPALMAYLEELMVELDFDLVQFQRVLFNTKTFQRAATAVEPDASETYHFPGPVLRRMSAEQIWDSVLTLVVDEIDGQLASPDAKSKRIYDSYERFTEMTDEELTARVEVEMVRFTDPERYRAMKRRERQQAQSGQRVEREEMQRRARELRNEMRKARRAGDRKRIAELRAEVEQLQRKGRKRAASRGLTRASDLPSPAPAAHLLRQFGQSDREQIEAAHTDASVPQVLTLLNGFVEQRMMQPASLLMRNIAEAKAPGDKVRTAYLAILGRLPESRELSMWKRDLDGGGPTASRDLVWTLMNTHEFRFIQ